MLPDDSLPGRSFQLPRLLVSVIVVNWNGLAFLDECFDSLARQDLEDTEFILVDNGSRMEAANS